MVQVPSTTKFVRTKGYYIRKRLPDGRLGAVHTEVAKRKYGIRVIPKGMVINHISGDKCDNRPSNLEMIPANKNIWLNHNYFWNKQTRAAVRNGALLGPGKRVRK